MLTIVVPGDEYFDEEKEEFVTVGDVVLELEHSLAALSKWESIWEKSFLSSGDKTTEEVYSYIECMIQTPNFPRGILPRLNQKNLDDINAYIEAKMTATWFRELPNQKQNREIITAEIVYSWMVALNIPFEAENWHLNKLITLIKVLSEKTAPPKKMSRDEALSMQRELNRKRREELGTRG